MQVASSSGWTLQLSYNDKHGKLEPGYFADNYPSVLELEVDSTFPELGTHFGQLLVTFKTSPDGYGQARISCPATVPTCTCNGFDMDAAAKGRSTSAKTFVVERLTQHKRCRVRVEVLPFTSSSGWKWKLLALAVRVENNTAML